MRVIARCLMLLALLAFSPVVRAQTDAAPIAAASDLQFALTELADAFNRTSGKAVKLVFGSSGNFHRQIREGAPFEMFLSADEGYVHDLAKAGLTLDAGVLYAVGRIVLLVPPHSPLKPDGTLADLKANLEAGKVKKFAIANPEHAPYGRAAREALVKAGVWDRVEPRLVLGENVSQAAQFAASGATSGGIVAYSLALSPRLPGAGQHALIPAEWHAPLNQRMVLTRKAGDNARAFYAYLQGAEARVVLQKYGFSAPGDR